MPSSPHTLILNNMNRPIKFRAWMKKEFSLPRASYDTFTIRELMSGKYGFSQYENWEENTGLLDKNGKEIYEGDVLKDETGNILTVDNPILGEFIYINYHEMGSGYIEDMQIIGNIYENPELLSNPI